MITLNANIKNYFKDARHIQIIYLSLFILFGVLTLNWEISNTKLLLVVGSCLITQFIWLKIFKKDLSGLKSALITGLGLTLLLYSDSNLTLVAASVLAISSKYLFKIKNKHLFNPANFGIIISILLFQDAWVSPGQWGSNAMFLFLLTVLGGLILFKVGRLETSVVFIVTLFLLEMGRTVIYQGWGFDVLFHKFSSGTLLLFTFFMITDPMTIPNSKKSRIIWSLILAISTFILSNWLQMYTAPIWILFFMTPLTVFLDKIYPDLKFEWNLTKSKKI